MTSPIAIIGLTYASTDLQEADLSIFLELQNGLGELEVRGRDTLVPSLVGMVPRPRKKERRRVNLIGHIRGVGDTQEDRRAAYWTTYKLIEELFSPDRLVADLVALLGDGTTATLESTRPLPGLAFVERVPSEWSDLSVPLESVAPDWTYA